MRYTSRPYVWLTAGTLLLTAIVGCSSSDDEGGGPDPIVGRWDGDGAGISRKNELRVADNMRGEATIHFYSDNVAYYVGFGVRHVVARGSEYTLEMKCDGDCAYFDYDMDCDIDGDYLYCNSRDDNWREYGEFRWRRR